VKMTCFFRGREITHQELGMRLLNRFVAELVDDAIIEQEPKQEGRNLSMIVAPKPHEEVKKAKPAEPETTPDAVS